MRSLHFASLSFSSAALFACNACSAFWWETETLKAAQDRLARLPSAAMVAELCRCSPALYVQTQGCTPSRLLGTFSPNPVPRSCLSETIYTTFTPRFGEAEPLSQRFHCIVRWFGRWVVRIMRLASRAIVKMDSRHVTLAALCSTARNRKLLFAPACSCIWPACLFFLCFRSLVTLMD